MRWEEKKEKEDKCIEGERRGGGRQHSFHSIWHLPQLYPPCILTLSPLYPQFFLTVSSLQHSFHNIWHLPQLYPHCILTLSPLYPQFFLTVSSLYLSNDRCLRRKRRRRGGGGKVRRRSKEKRRVRIGIRMRNA